MVPNGGSSALLIAKTWPVVAVVPGPLVLRVISSTRVVPPVATRLTTVVKLALALNVIRVLSPLPAKMQGYAAATPSGPAQSLAPKPGALHGVAPVNPTPEPPISPNRLSVPTP